MPNLDPDVGPWLQGGGLLAFAGAVWYQVREVAKLMARVLELLAVLEDRSRPEPESDDDQPTPRLRRRHRSAPRGYPVRVRPGDTDPE